MFSLFYSIISDFLIAKYVKCVELQMKLFNYIFISASLSFFQLVSVRSFLYTQINE